MQKLKRLWIPIEILLDEKLTDKEKIILSMILYLSDETGSCFASNQYKPGGTVLFGTRLLIIACQREPSLLVCPQVESPSWIIWVCLKKF